MQGPPNPAVNPAPLLVDTWRLRMKPFTTVAVVVFSIVALLQLLRVVLAWEITVNGFAIPLWASVIACVVAATLAFLLSREARK